MGTGGGSSGAEAVAGRAIEDRARATTTQPTGVRLRAAVSASVVALVMPAPVLAWAESGPGPMIRGGRGWAVPEALRGRASSSIACRRPAAGSPRRRLTAAGSGRSRGASAASSS